MSSPEALKLGKFYHIYNRGNNRENLFCEKRNYQLFLKLYVHHIFPVADTYAYVMLKNHFHLLIRTRTEEEQKNLWIASRLRKLGTVMPSSRQEEEFKLLEPSQQFANLFNAYARTFNYTYKRTGTLFQRPFGRILVQSDRYFRRLVVYIHQNPQKHGFVKDFREWHYSSYHTLLSLKTTLLLRDDVLSRFDNRDGFDFAHSQPMDDRDLIEFFPDDFD